MCFIWILIRLIYKEQEHERKRDKEQEYMKQDIIAPVFAHSDRLCLSAVLHLFYLRRRNATFKTHFWFLICPFHSQHIQSHRVYIFCNSLEEVVVWTKFWIYTQVLINKSSKCRKANHCQKNGFRRAILL